MEQFEKRESKKIHTRNYNLTTGNGLRGQTPRYALTIQLRAKMLRTGCYIRPKPPHEWEF